MMNSVHSLPTNLPTDFIDEINSVDKNDTSSFFLLCFNFFSHCNFLGIYRWNFSVGKIPLKFTDGNIPSVFLFVFINFLGVKEHETPPYSSNTTDVNIFSTNQHIDDHNANGDVMI
jgi:hypothetical protein